MSVPRQSPLPVLEAAVAELSCVLKTARLIVAGRITLPVERCGTRIDFADGTSAFIYRETVLRGAEPGEPCALVVKFRLRAIRGKWHGIFRLESLLNTPLFVGFPGFVSKFWLAHDEHDIYRGIYEWDGPERAEHYARALWRVLQIGCEPTSIEYVILPLMRRDQLLTQPELIEGAASDSSSAWWRPVTVHERPP